MKVTTFETHGNQELANVLNQNFDALAALEGANVYRVIQTSKAFYTDFVNKYQQKYSDGSMAVYGDPGDGSGIQAAINACKGGRGDYIIVGSGAYQLTAAIDLTGKSSVHLLGLNGQTLDVGSLGAALLQQTGNFEIVKMEAYCELAGFQLINKAAYAAVSCAAGKWRPTVHHNYFHMVGDAGGANNLVDWSTSTSGVSGRIYRNKFTTWVGAALNAAINVGLGTGIDVVDNQIVASATAMVLANGIINQSIGGVTARNIVSEAGGDGVASNGGTVTKAIVVNACGTVVDNRCAVGTGQGLDGGTADHSFVGNLDGENGGATPIET